MIRSHSILSDKSFNHHQNEYYGIDLIIQSKSGTGKTLVYCTIILERYSSVVKTPQSLVVVPTREIALQVEAYLNSIGSNCSGKSDQSNVTLKHY